ncbi:MAG TPA: hypothetical protein VKY82_05985 [Flavobacterium sp.]|nr:hypothetical protein [Flavobacterium sp.]
MKKLMIFFMLATTMISCSDDDQQNTTTPFKGTWIVENILYADEDKDQSVSTMMKSINDITFSSEFIFSNDEYMISNNDEVLSKGTFSYESINDNELLDYYLTLYDNNNFEKSFSVQYKSNTSIVLFSTSEPSVIYELKR